MPDNLKIRKPLDSQRINVNQPYELGRWSVRLGVSDINKLKLAVKRVGSLVVNVRKWLKTHPD
jgi:hypothetical protein